MSTMSTMVARFSEHAPPAQAVLEILVVEDDAQLARSISMLLGDHGLTLATTGRQAVACCAEHDYDLILCDLFMREMNGMEAYEEIRRLRPGLERRMVFMTGGAFTPHAQRFLDGLPNSILQKPFGADDLLRVVAASSESPRAS